MKKSAFSFLTTRTITLFMLAILLAGGFTSCNSKKKAQAAAEAKRKADMEAAKQRKIDKAVADLRTLINDDSKSADQLQSALNEIKGRGVKDPEVDRLIKLVEDKIADKRKAEAEEAKRLEEERKRAEEMKNNTGGEPTTVEGYFAAISNAKSTADANRLIDGALKFFSSPNADVLIIITMAGGEPDYDEPTTISKYLNYLKDQRKNLNKVYKTEKDGAGKIKLLELIRK